MKKSKKRSKVVTMIPDKLSKNSRSNKSKIYVIFVSVAVSMIAIFLAYNYNFTKEADDVLENYIKANLTYSKKTFNISCMNNVNDEIKTSPVFKSCTPTAVCGRAVRDDLVSQNEVDTLKSIAKKSFEHGQSNGGASIFDIHSGALSMGDKFVNIYKYVEQSELRKIFTKKDLQTYRNVKNKILTAVCEEYGLQKENLYLTSPTFFSRMTNKPAKTTHDEYWHKHIDKIQYGSFDYTTLLYLSDYESEFTGGRFFFDSKEKDGIVEPKSGRVSFFTSGAENPHHVEKVKSGIRFAVTVSFTCDPQKAILDPEI